MRPPRLGEHLASEQRHPGELDARADALRALQDAGARFVVAGAYALFEYTGIFRDTKDLDVFLEPREFPVALAALQGAGFRTELIDPVWIAKAWRGEWFVDLIFASGNGVAQVDAGWMTYGRPAEVMGVPVLLAAPEEIVWSKAFVCERDRFDGHDVANLLRACAADLDWGRLLARFGDEWEVLLAQVLLYRYAFPSERSRVPDRVMRELLRRASETVDEGDWGAALCRGPLLSRHAYRHALEHLGYHDARASGRAQQAAARDAGRGGEGDGAAVSPGGGG